MSMRLQINSRNYKWLMGSQLLVSIFALCTQEDTWKLFAVLFWAVPPFLERVHIQWYFQEVKSGFTTLGSMPDAGHSWITWGF